MRQLSVEFVSNRPFLQHKDEPIARRRHRIDVDVDDPIRAEARCTEIDPVFVDRTAALDRLFDEAEKRRAERHDVG